MDKKIIEKLNSYKHINAYGQKLYNPPNVDEIVNKINEIIDVVNTKGNNNG